MKNNSYDSQRDCIDSYHNGPLHSSLETVEKPANDRLSPAATVPVSPTISTTSSGLQQGRRQRNVLYFDNRDVTSHVGDEDDDDDDDDDEEEDEFGEPFSPTQLGRAPSSAFFKPAHKNDHDHSARRGMMSPVLGTEALYKQAGWVTPQEHIYSGKTATEFSTESSDVNVENSGANMELNSEKPKRLLSVHTLNKDFQSKQTTDHSFDVGVASTEPKAISSSLDGMAPVQMLHEGIAMHSKNAQKVDNLSAKSIAVQQASYIRGDLQDSVPTVLGMVPIRASNDQADFGADDDEGSDDGRGYKNDTPSGSKGGREETLPNDDSFTIPKSIREIYKISNRNRRNKKMGSPPPDREVYAANDKEKDELMKAESLLRERGLVGDDGNGYLFEDSAMGSSPGKRPRAKSGRESEESVPDAANNFASKEDDLAFMKQVGWIKDDEDVDDILNQRYGKSMTAEYVDTEGVSSGVEDLEVRKGSVNSGAEFGSRSPFGQEPVIGLIQPNHVIPGNNPFFSGSAMVGGPLTQQGLSKNDSQRPRKNGPGRGKPSRGKQYERPDKRGDRTFAYRKK